MVCVGDGCRYGWRTMVILYKLKQNAIVLIKYHCDYYCPFVSVSFISKLTVESLYMYHNSQDHRANEYTQNVWTKPHFNHAHPGFSLGTAAGFHPIFGRFTWVSSDVIYLSLSICITLFCTFFFLLCVCSCLFACLSNYMYTAVQKLVYDSRYFSRKLHTTKTYLSSSPCVVKQSQEVQYCSSGIFPVEILCANHTAHKVKQSYKVKQPLLTHLIR